MSKIKIALAVTALIGFSSSVTAEELRVGTASQGGAFYPVGQAVSTLVNSHAKDLTMVPVVTQGSVQNPKLVNNGEVDVGITNNNLAVFANKGILAYKKDGAMELRGLGALHFSILHMVTLADSDINTVADLKGKKIAIGPAGGGTIPFTKQVLGLHGVDIKDITPSFLSYSDGFSQLSDGNVDAAFALSGFPAGAVMQARVNKKLKFIKITPEALATALGKYENYNEVTVPKDVYDMDDDSVVLGVNNLLFVRADMDDEKAYQITKAVYGNLGEFQELNSHAKQINPENSKKLKIPLHPGAARFHNE
ncbi:TRAP transporter substrate-binding protein [Leucothrix arctica]|uniref:TRAP transporter substrate-binding protein n=2 Tax=Leucothrix arctica TaxID=1481894 RepID=A0A317C823_9GAMM|nr:TRAP transporter substrate-binding protein [Leucothrix arctica]